MLAYETRAGQDRTNPQYDYVITHHSSFIAFIGPWNVEVSNAGWGSSTTRTRLNMILRDNNIPASVKQRDFVQVLVFAGKSYPNFRWAEFRMVAGVWTLNDGQFNDE
jgi:hypothetical protein